MAATESAPPHHHQGAHPHRRHSNGNATSGGGGSTAGGSLGRDHRLQHQKQITEGISDDELEESKKESLVLERVKLDRAAVTKPEEDRRRRTIIVEKRKGSYGFTLQSYGIHYKKEQEIEMITYVDYVEYDGPAYRSGMREGDVILSINGTDMEKANHKRLVEFIKDCDTRMRMVVLFEDCVRKVELHMRYIKLQTVLQDKMNELDRVCLREREILEGKWKTHSLPARKKTTTSPSESGENAASPNDAELQSPFYRPTLSTEDVNLGRQKPAAFVPPTPQYMLTYQYLDPNYRYVLKPSTSSSSGEYFVSIGPGRSDHHYILARSGSTDNATNLQKQQSQLTYKRATAKTPVDQLILTNEQTSSQNGAEQQKPPKSGRHCHGGHSCNPCLGHFGKKIDKTGDNVSLDAYDLASPCCEPHCVPTRRRSRHHKEHHHKHKHRDKESKDRPRPRSQSHATSSPGQHHHHHHHNMRQNLSQHLQQPSGTRNSDNKTRYYDLTAGLASHCSLHSYASSTDFAPADSSASYTTSLSTDTLYWDPQSENGIGGNSRQHSTKSKSSYQMPSSEPGTIGNQQQTQPHLQQGVYQHRYHLHAAQIQPGSQIYHHPQYAAAVHKPKSWDNLTTKAFGGYGFGYGYLDAVAPRQTVKLQVAQQRHSIPRKNPYGRYSTFTDVENYAPPPSQFVEETTTTMITTKSTENLINTYNMSDKASVRSCDCGGTDNQASLKKQSSVPPTATGVQQQYHHVVHPLNFKQFQTSAPECRLSYYSNLPRPTHNASTSTHNGGVATISEITRL